MTDRTFANGETGAAIRAKINGAIGNVDAHLDGGTSVGAKTWGDAVNANIVPDADGTRNLGTPTFRFASISVDAVDLNGVPLDGVTALAAPAGDRILFYDLSATAAAWLSPGAGLSITATTMAVTFGPNLPQNSRSAAYTAVIGDANGHIYHPSADTTARIWTIPANASVPFAIGDAITFVNDIGAGVLTIAITTDTLAWMNAASSGTGSRTLAAGGMATALKVTATRWVISGVGLT